MKKEDITLLAQILSGMKDSTKELEIAQKDKDAERLIKVKREILNFQKEIEKIL